jgi:hypothetical protein
MAEECLPVENVFSTKLPYTNHLASLFSYRSTTKQKLALPRYSVLPDGCMKIQVGRRDCKTYSSRDSHVVTHRSTNLPFNCLCMAERTGCPVFS